MTNQFNIKGTLRAWVPEWRTVKDLREAAKDSGNRAAEMLQFTGADQDMSDYGWIEVGTANIDATIDDTVDVTQKQVERLREQIKTVQAAAQEKVNALEDRIKSLLAITYEEPTHE